MQENKQRFFYAECRMCGRIENKYEIVFKKIPEKYSLRKFVTCANNPNEAICTNCSFKISVDDTQLNQIGGKTNGNN